MFATKKLRFRLLCVLMSVVTPLTPSAAVLAQSPDGIAENANLQYILPYSAAIVSARPKQLLTSEMAQALPIEVVQAAGIKELGLDPLTIESIVFSMIPPLAGPPSYAIFVTFTERFELSTLSPKLTQHTVPAQRDGKPYLQSQTQQEPSMIWVGEKTLLLAPEHSLNQLLTAKPGEPDSFAKQLTECANDDAALLINLEGLRPLIQLGLNQARNEIPAEYQQFLEIPNLLKQARLRVNLSGQGPIELSVATNDERSSDRMEELIEELMAVYRKQASMQAARMLQSADPVEQAMGRYINRVTPAWSEEFMPARNGERFTFFEFDSARDSNSQLTTVVAICRSPRGTAITGRPSGARSSTADYFVEQRSADYVGATQFRIGPRTFARARELQRRHGKPLLSWRVHILPYLEQQELYDQFHLDEPWDSEHNRQLISLMPETYIDPSSPRSHRQRWKDALPWREGQRPSL